MNRIGLTWDSALERMDIAARPDNKLAWLENAVLISLFTDARAQADDAIPDGSSDRRGYWGDLFLDEAQSLGSRLWLLRREKTTRATVEKCRAYCIEALEWLLDDDHVSAVDIATERQGNDRIAIAITLTLPNGTETRLFTEHVNAL